MPSVIFESSYNEFHVVHKPQRDKVADDGLRVKEKGKYLLFKNKPGGGSYYLASDEKEIDKIRSSESYRDGSVWEGGEQPVRDPARSKMPVQPGMGSTKVPTPQSPAQSKAKPKGVKLPKS